MNRTDPGGPRRQPDGANPEAESAAAPATLGELMDWLIDQRGYRSLAQVAKQTDIPYSTLWAWKQRTRNVQRPPAAQILRQFAADLDLPEGMVFRAAGRAYSATTAGELGDDELQVLHLYQELAPADREFAEQMLRNLAERTRRQDVTRS
jgi:transcriptional regulator with XRE-family HTH domain